MYFDWTYVVLVLPAVLLSMIASSSVKSTFKKYSKVISSRGLTASDAAARVIRAAGLTTTVSSVAGELTDHYDPEANTVRLSESVFSSRSIAAIGVACHEVGHAMQHAEGYTPIRIRSAIIPVTNFGAKLSTPLIIAGLLLSGVSYYFTYVAYAGLACFALCAVFQLVTLPVEFNASRRAMRCMEEMELLDDDELRGARKVLTAAAMTYVAALAVTLMQLLRFFILISGSRRRD